MAETPQPALAPERPRSALDELLDRRRLLLFLGVLVLELVIFVAGLFTPLSSQAQNTLENATNNQFASVPTASAPQLVSLIFTHNVVLALVELIPVVGAFFFLYSIYITGLVAQVLAASAGYPSLFGMVLFLFPYSLVELSAYAIAAGAGVMLLVASVRKRLRRELRVLPLEIAAVVGVLLAAAVMETATRFYPVLGFALWIPTGAAIAGIIVISSRRQR